MAVCGAGQAANRHRSQEDRDQAQAAAFGIAGSMPDLQAIISLNRTIRGLMAVLRSCTTPASRAVVAARVRPLVEQRAAIERRYQ